MVAKGQGIPDPECPTSVADFAYWVITSRERTQVESVEHTTQMKAAVHSNDAMDVFAGTDDGRLDGLLGVGLSSGEGPSAADLLKFVTDSAASASSPPGAASLPFTVAFMKVTKTSKTHIKLHFW